MTALALAVFFNSARFFILSSLSGERLYFRLNSAIGMLVSGAMSSVIFTVL